MHKLSELLILLVDQQGRPAAAAAEDAAAVESALWKKIKLWKTTIKIYTDAVDLLALACAGRVWACQKQISYLALLKGLALK